MDKLSRRVAERFAQSKPTSDDHESRQAVAPPGWEPTVKKMKAHPEVTNPWSLSWWMKNNGYKPGGKKASLEPALEEAEEPESESHQVRTFLDTHMKKLKGNGWWLPPHNLVVNMAIMNMNLWFFSILARFAQPYRPASDRLPEGIVIDPGWNSFRNGDLAYTVKSAEFALRTATEQRSIHESIKADLAIIEQKSGVKIPTHIGSKLEADALKVAERRWGVNQLRQKKLLVPFDGGKSIPLGTFD